MPRACRGGAGLGSAGHALPQAHSPGLLPLEAVTVTLSSSTCPSPPLSRFKHGAPLCGLLCAAPVKRGFLLGHKELLEERTFASSFWLNTAVSAVALVPLHKQHRCN